MRDIVYTHPSSARLAVTAAVRALNLAVSSATCVVHVACVRTMGAIKLANQVSTDGKSVGMEASGYNAANCSVTTASLDVNDATASVATAESCAHEVAPFTASMDAVKNAALTGLVPCGIMSS